MTEKTIETFFKKKVESELKGKVLKLNSMSMNGLPDRMVLIPEGRIFFAELKAPGKKPRPLQLAAHKILRSLGFNVYVIDTKERVLEVLAEWILDHTTTKK